jgi:hypothetical protein
MSAAPDRAAQTRCARRRVGVAERYSYAPSLALHHAVLFTLRGERWRYGVAILSNFDRNLDIDSTESTSCRWQTNRHEHCAKGAGGEGGGGKGGGGRPLARRAALFCMDRAGAERRSGAAQRSVKAARGRGRARQRPRWDWNRPRMRGGRR